MARRSIAFLSCFGLATVLVAQSSVVVPGSAAVSEGFSLAGVTGGSFAFRTQILVDASALAASGAQLTGLRLRADRTVGPQAGIGVPNVTVRIGPTTVAVGAMSATFANNVTAPLTTVFQGTLNLPPQGADSFGPRPFDVDVPFQQPFSFLATQGNLLVELVGNNPPCFGICNPLYWLDVACAGGTTSSLGTPGTMANGDSPVSSVTTSVGGAPLAFTIGTTLEYVTNLVLSAPPAVAAFATAPLPGPVDLTPIGAPGNVLWVDPTILVPLSWSPGFGFTATVSLPVPNVPALVGVTVWQQSAVFDPAANALGLVLGNGTETRLGDPGDVPVAQTCEGVDPAATDGFVLDGCTLALRLDGTFF